MESKIFYISLPITGKDIDAQRERAKHIQRVLTDRFGMPVINPFELYDGMKFSLQCEPSLGDILGLDVRTIINNVNTVVFDTGWENSRGCQLEYHTADIYNKNIRFFEEIDKWADELIPSAMNKTKRKA